MDILYEIIKTAEQKFGISAVKPYQILVIHRIVEQDRNSGEIRNQIVILPTGTGKSLCFLTGALLCKGITVVVYPLLALMNDQISKLKENGIDCISLRGGQTKEQREEAFNRLSHGTKIVITNPETLNQQKIVNRLKNFNISLLVCDEAHVISLWGKNFRPAYTELGKTVRILNARQVLAFTATASKETINDISHVLFKKKPLVVRSDSDRENIIYYRYPTYDRFCAVSHLVANCQKPAIVFCPTRNLTKQLCYFCKRICKSVPMYYYNAGLSKNERQWIENDFMKQTEAALFATCAYGMGVDKKDIRTVIHYEAPNSALDYLQQSGRAGRDGKISTAWVVCDVLSESRAETSEVGKIFNSNDCRRTSLLALLEENKEECTGCDVCFGSVLKEPKTKNIITKIVKRSPYRYTVDYLAALLNGKNSIEKMNDGDTMDPYYGSFQDYDCRALEMEIKAMTRPGGPLGIAYFTKPVLYPHGKYYDWLTSVCEFVLTVIENKKIKV